MVLGILMTTTIRSIRAASETALPPFLLSIDVVAGRVAIYGDFDRGHVEQFLEAFGLLAFFPTSAWSVDVSAVTFCDVGGLRGLLAAERLAERAGRSFQVTGARSWMRQLLPMVGLSVPAESERILRAVR
jgi:anti-anti-sigma regulatory factor